MPQSELTRLRSQRTRDATAIQRLSDQMIHGEARDYSPDGLPSWWPFWSDCVAEKTRNLVRFGRQLQALEGREVYREP